jgi:hypothetical protein
MELSLDSNYFSIRASYFNKFNLSFSGGLCTMKVKKSLYDLNYMVISTPLASGDHIAVPKDSRKRQLSFPSRF